MNNESGSSVRMNSSTLISIFDRMFEVIKNMNEEVYSIYEIKDRCNKEWQGKAANIVLTNYEKVNSSLQDGNIKRMYQRIIDAVNLIEENKKISAELSEKEFEYINMIQSLLEEGQAISSVQVSGINKPETGTITSDINANNTISSVQTDFDAIPVNTELNNSVSMDTTIESNSVSVDDIYKPTTDSISEVVNNTVTSSQVTETASEPTNEQQDNLGTVVGAGALGELINQKGGV